MAASRRPTPSSPTLPGTQGWNLYAYVANNPTTWIDPTGHTTWPTTRPTTPENMAPLIVPALVVGAATALGVALAANFQMLADIFWLLAQPGRVLFDVLDDYETHAKTVCQAGFDFCVEFTCAGKLDWDWAECWDDCHDLYDKCLEEFGLEV